MFRKTVIISLLAIFVFSLSGCATVKRKDLEIQGLKNNITVLNQQIQAKDEEINTLKDALSKAEAEKQALTTRKKIGEVKSRPNIKQIQAALRNAGFDPGRVDGKMGKATHDAIKAFQKANNLIADGKVGKQTWLLLKEYLYKKVK